jgi:hypothetical protein
MSPPPAKKRRQERSNNGNNNVVKASSKEHDDNTSPVLVHHLDYSQGKRKKTSLPKQFSLQSGLDELLAPMLKEDFLAHCLRKRAVHITTNTSNAKNQECQSQRVTQLRQEMCNLDAATILRETSSDNIFLWLRPNGATYQQATNGENKRDFIQSVEISDVETAIALHKTAGHATYCRAPPKVEQCLVSNLLRETGLGCGQYDPSGESTIKLGRGEVETFISTEGHLTNWHYDFQENLTIQLSGTKRWTLRRGTIQDPMRGCTPHYAAPEAVESQLKAAHLFDTKFQFGFPQPGVNAVGDSVVIDVKPGDVLYFPAGMWHKVETVAPGVSINVSLMASNYASMTCQALQHFLLRDPKWRQPVLQNGTQNAVEHLKRLLHELPDKIRELERDGKGAEAILPPVLQYPPQFQINDGDDAEDWESVEGQERVGEEASPSEEYSDGANYDEEEEEKVLENDHEGRAVIDPLTFDGYPKGWSCFGDVDLPELRFVRNPLASLLKLADITSFYKDATTGDKHSSRDDATYVLNVNFAGNEMHESAVRILLQDNPTRVISQLYDRERKGHGEEVIMPRQEGAKSISKFLLFHGYLLQS